ncbi:MAG: F-type H+-transporting ATPase subunit epsilon [Alphaproteobacteria bacterium]|jgi:F-type H+-transporting ATPase subunit epsilon
MRDALNLQILSPANIAFTGAITSVHVPAALGELEIYSNHTSFVSSLLPGYITVRHDGNAEERYFTNAGYVEVNENKVSLIVDDIIDASVVNKDYLQEKIDILTPKLQNFLEDAEYEKITQSIARYQQYITQ